MDAKFNEATYNRPEGDRIIDAPFVFIDIENYHRQLKEEDAWSSNDRNGITVFKSEKQTVVLTAFHAGAKLPEKEIKGRVMIHVLEGLLRINIGGEDCELKKGNIVVLQEGVKHCVNIQDDSLVMITTNLN